MFVYSIVDECKGDHSLLTKSGTAMSPGRRSACREKCGKGSLQLQVVMYVQYSVQYTVYSTKRLAAPSLIAKAARTPSGNRMLVTGVILAERDLCGRSDDLQLK